jgi:hypothetical protein
MGGGWVGGLEGERASERARDLAHTHTRERERQEGNASHLQINSWNGPFVRILF